MRIVIKDIMKICKCSENVALKVEEHMEIEDFDFSQSTQRQFRVAAVFSMSQI